MLVVTVEWVDRSSGGELVAKTNDNDDYDDYDDYEDDNEEDGDDERR